MASPLWKNGNGHGLVSFLERRMARKALHFVLVDPDKARNGEAARVARAAAAAGSDALLVGGSTGLTPVSVARTVESLRAEFSGPILLFPSSTRAFSPNADGILFLSLLNSRSRRFIVGEQVRGAEAIRRSGVEPIPTAYLIVAPGRRAGRVGRATPLPRERPSAAARYALAAQMLGMRWVYLEAGSGADQPVPPGLVSRVRASVDLPLLVGGGVRTPAQARALVEAGASAVVTGTAVERAADPAPLLQGFARAIHGASHGPGH
ncbi:MAG: geranylgeranylglyceryl/heptaprenylglyceryl phosphate synthase [Halobacteria archaeon]